MNIQRSTFNVQRPTSLGATLVVFVTFLCALAALRETASAQTNTMLSGSTATNPPLPRLPALSDFQKLQYYYAAQPKSPAPGTEHAIFTLKPDRTWSGDWNSKNVAKPTRKQLDAITPQQMDLFRRAGAFSDGAWKLVTSQTNIPLSTLTVTADNYMRLRLTIERDKALQKYQSAETALQALSPAAASEAK